MAQMTLMAQMSQLASPTLASPTLASPTLASLGKAHRRQWWFGLYRGGTR